LGEHTEDTGENRDGDTERRLGEPSTGEPLGEDMEDNGENRDGDTERRLGEPSAGEHLGEDTDENREGDTERRLGEEPSTAGDVESNPGVVGEFEESPGGDPETDNKSIGGEDTLPQTNSLELISKYSSHNLSNLLLMSWSDCGFDSSS